MGPAFAASSTCPLRHRGWRSRTRSLQLDLCPTFLLSARQGARTCLPWQVRRRSEDGLPRRQDRVPWSSHPSRRAAQLRRLAQMPVPARLGRLLQASLRRTRTCPALSRRLHPPRRHLQQQAHRARGRQGHLPLEGLRARQQKASDASAGRRVPAPLPAAPAAMRLRAHPQLRLPCYPPTSHAAAALLPTSPECIGTTNPTTASRPITGPSQVPALWRNNARHRATHSSPTSPSFSAFNRQACSVNPQLQTRNGPHARAWLPLCAFRGLLPHCAEASDALGNHAVARSPVEAALQARLATSKSW